VTSLLQVEREHEEERRLTGPESELRDEARPERAITEQRQIEQRRATPPGEAALLREERRQDRGRRRERDPRPDRPTVLTSLDQRQHDRRQPGTDEYGADQIEAAGPLTTRLGDEPWRQRQRYYADRHVDQEAASPAKAGDVRLHQHAADQLTADGRQPHRDPVDAERPEAVGSGVGNPDDRQHVGHQQRPGYALREARHDEDRRAARRAAGGRGDREQSESDRERSSATDPVAETAGGDQEDCRGQGVARDDPFDRSARRVEVRLNRRQCDVDDEEVQHDHEGPG
jgi:hypothetical protein